ncbi:hypothetical protein Tco_0268028 [Tanacetum coccineum]
MSKAVKIFVRECDVCQRHKPNLEAYQGLLQPLLVPGHISKYISMDFIHGLPSSQGDMVYLKLQPYRQITVRQGMHYKLSAKFYGRFKVIERIGEQFGGDGGLVWRFGHWSSQWRFGHWSSQWRFGHWSSLGGLVIGQVMAICNSGVFCEDMLKGAQFGAKTKIFEDFGKFINTSYPTKNIRRVSVKLHKKTRLSNSQYGVSMTSSYAANSTIEDATWEWVDDLQRRFPQFKLDA